jgi:hypothetical protein
MIVATASPSRCFAARTMKTTMTRMRLQMSCWSHCRRQDIVKSKVGVALRCAVGGAVASMPKAPNTTELILNPLVARAMIFFSAESYASSLASGAM